jgi:hypothetical protein
MPHQACFLHINIETRNLFKYAEKSVKKVKTTYIILQEENDIIGKLKMEHLKLLPPHPKTLNQTLLISSINKSA